jgi:hypothetical protein
MNSTTNYLEWVTIAHASTLTGATRDALREHIKKGHLEERIHWIKKKNRIWIHLGRFNQWLENTEA